MVRFGIALLAVAGLMTGCGGSGDAGEEDTTSAVTSATDVYWMANQCLFLSSEQGDELGYVSASASIPTYSILGGPAEAFYFKPTALGRYMLFDSQARWLVAGEVPQAAGLSQLDERADWQLYPAENNQYHLRSTVNDQWLAINGSQLQYAPTAELASSFYLTPTDGCAEFPEASTNSAGAPVRASFDDGAVWGMADAHAHVFGSMAFAGNVMSGDVFHPLGITKALQDCRAEHGVNGWMDLTGFITGGPGDEFDQISKIPARYIFGQPFHDTRGYPDFTFWPNAQTKTHAMGYYKWLERAHLGGLRLMVNLLVESPPLCQVARSLNQWYAPYDPGFRQNPDVVCTGEASAMAQLDATYALQNYIDAQEGGPGKGWLRIVTTPEQAREVIEQKKMAMIIGVELPDLFDCINGVETGSAQCSTEYVERRLDEYYDLGIRTVFPVHHYDNYFGGAVVFNPIVEIAKVVQNGELFRYEPCEEAGYDPLLALKIPQMYYNLFPEALKNLPLFPFLPQADNYCNAESVTPLGEHLALAMMKRGMLIETNHMSSKMKRAVLELAEAYDYPLMDTHQRKAWDDAGKAFESRYLALGGVRSPMPNMVVTVDEYAGIRKTCENSTSQDLAMQIEAVGDVRQQLGVDTGVVISTDVHGMVSQAQPRFGELANCDEMQMLPVEYPFTSVDGGVVFERQQTGNRVFDFNTDGLAHYGLLPDMVEDMRRQGLSEAKIESLFRGAESYLQAWEKALRRSAALTE